MNDKSSRKPAFQQPSSSNRFSDKGIKGTSDRKRQGRSGDDDRNARSERNPRNDRSDRNERNDKKGRGFGENRTFERSARADRRKGGFERNDERRDDRKPRAARPSRENQDNTAPAYVWGERELNATKAGKNTSGNVKVMIKGEVKGEKKTGPLSPRAPEKIRKNRNEEMKIYGEAACIAVFRQRPDSIVRLWANIDTSHRIGKLTSYLATQKKAYHIVENDELELVSGSEHHGGICLLVKKATPMTLDGYLKSEKRQDCVLLLDGLNNAHNIGGVIRTAAYYGVKGIVCESADQLYSAAAARVAEGGMEQIYALESHNTELAIQQLKSAGYQVLALTANKQAEALNKLVLGDKVALVLRETVSAENNPLADHNVVLSFENPLTSGLNVAVNAGILLSRWYFR
ncbi:TrmH family RNA methyltransferase [Testudinibacter sp. P80/BLE/0925]|uniref:TrmH family RNA methyltransferase n=1 Tax=Testudinibacter sp. TW-1 TaxID=3417757 RepID=UPI003D36C7C5